MDNNPLGRFSPAARLVIVLCIVGSAAGTFAYVSWAQERLPFGRYPVGLFAVPIFLLGILIGAAGLILLRLCGVPVYRSEAEQSPEASEKQEKKCTFQQKLDEGEN